MKKIKSKTVMFITGAFVGNNCWDEWHPYFQNSGYKTIAPPWPRKDAPPPVLRSRHPHSPIAEDTFPELIQHHIDIIKNLPEKPIGIGHSTGGLITQILLNKGYLEAGVAIHSLPPQGVIPTQLSFYRGAGASLGLLTSINTTYLMPFKTWQFAFTNTMPLSVQKKTYEDIVVPESKRLTRGALTKAAKIDFKKAHGPLLFTSGEIDNIIPAALNMKNYKRYAQNNGSVTDYKEFKGRNHYVLGQSTWKEDADYILDWINKQ